MILTRKCLVHSPSGVRRDPRGKSATLQWLRETQARTLSFFKELWHLKVVFRNRVAVFWDEPTDE